jgi:excisionase family DNA binding protein
MSSNLNYLKQCLFCLDYFEAKTLYTKYCTHKCNSRHYKQLAREKKINAVQADTKKQASDVPFLRLVEIQQKVFLTITEAALFVGVSTRTIERMIASSTISVSRFNRRVLIKRQDLEQFM